MMQYRQVIHGIEPGSHCLQLLDTGATADPQWMPIHCNPDARGIVLLFFAKIFAYHTGIIFIVNSSSEIRSNLNLMQKVQLTSETNSDCPAMKLCWVMRCAQLVYDLTSSARMRIMVDFGIKGRFFFSSSTLFSSIRLFSSSDILPLSPSGCLFSSSVCADCPYMNK